MQFGICTTAERVSSALQAGWDFVEESVQSLLQEDVPDAQWDGLRRARAATLPIPAANCLVPGGLKITGPTASPPRLQQYMTTVIDRAARVGVRTLVFGSGAARNVPDGFDRARAREQIHDFARMSAELAAPRGITIVI